MGRCSLLVGLRSSSQPLDQLALLFREFWGISGRFWGDDKQYRAYDRALGDTTYGLSHLG